MIYLLEKAIEIAQNYAHDEDSDHELAQSCEMGVLLFSDEVTGSKGRAINVLLCTGSAPAIAQVVIEDDGTVIDNAALDEIESAQILVSQIEEAKARIRFCEEALNNMGFEISNQEGESHVS